MLVMHGLTMEFHSVAAWVLSTRRQRPMIAMPIIKAMIYVSIEAVRAMEPGTGADKNAPRKPLRSVITIRCAIVRRNLIVPVGANGRFSDTDRNLCRCLTRRHKKQSGGNCREPNILQTIHFLHLSGLESVEPDLVVRVTVGKRTVSNFGTNPSRILKCRNRIVEFCFTCSFQLYETKNHNARRSSLAKIAATTILAPNPPQKKWNLPFNLVGEFPPERSSP